MEITECLSKGMTGSNFCIFKGSFWPLSGEWPRAGEGGKQREAAAAVRAGNGGGGGGGTSGMMPRVEGTVTSMQRVRGGGTKHDFQVSVLSKQAGRWGAVCKNGGNLRRKRFQGIKINLTNL